MTPDLLHAMVAGGILGVIVWGSVTRIRGPGNRYPIRETLDYY